MNRNDLSNICNWQKQNFRRFIEKKSKFSKNDITIQRSFSDQSDAPKLQLDALFHYFWEAHCHYRSEGSTEVYYPGIRSIYGAKNDGFEGMSRLMPLLAAFASDPSAPVVLSSEISRYIISVLQRGTNPESPYYWGDISDYSPLICEAADIALSIWLLKDSIWKTLDRVTQQTTIQWLKQAIARKTADNNWHLFVILIDKVLEDLDEEHRFSSMERYQRIKAFYLGDGCFKDGENGQVDLYNAWGFHYYLYWLTTIDPNFDNDFIQSAIFDYASWYQYLFTRQGLPLFGRSLCYRMATPVPIQAANDLFPSDFSHGSTLNTLYSCWSFFVSNGALRFGRPTQGIFNDNALWVDPYSGPASAFWCTRSLVIHYFRSRRVDWSEIALLPLPSEGKKTDLHVKAAELQITTNPKDQTSKVVFHQHVNDFCHESLNTPSFKDRTRALIFGISQRPSNNLMKNSVKFFESNLNYYR